MNGTLGSEVQVGDQPGEPGEVADSGEVESSEEQQRALLKVKRGRMGRAMRAGQLAHLVNNADIEKCLDNIPSMTEVAFENLVRFFTEGAL